MVLVEIGSNAILVKPMNSRKDANMILVYCVSMSPFKQSGTIPKKHVLDN